MNIYTYKFCCQLAVPLHIFTLELLLLLNNLGNYCMYRDIEALLGCIGLVSMVILIVKGLIEIAI